MDTATITHNDRRFTATNRSQQQAMMDAVESWRNQAPRGDFAVTVDLDGATFGHTLQGSDFVNRPLR
jgi:hypothetical protein